MNVDNYLHVIAGTFIMLSVTLGYYVKPLVVCLYLFCGC